MPSYFPTLLVYVDDIVLSRDDPSEIAYVKSFLNNTFKINDLGSLRYFLGLEIARSPQGLLINQHKYSLELLGDTETTAIKPSSKPYDSGLKIHGLQSPLLDDIYAFRRLTCRLLYLTTTRPNIAFSLQ